MLSIGYCICDNPCWSTNSHETYSNISNPTLIRHILTLGHQLDMCEICCFYQPIRATYSRHIPTLALAFVMFEICLRNVVNFN